MPRFFRYSLRSTDVQAGRRFYAEAIGLSLPEPTAAGSSLESWPLHEGAVARGVPAHWLGHVAVDDVEESLARWVAAGAQQLGPLVRIDEQRCYATIADPSGAVFALRQGEPDAGDAPVAWHQLHTDDAERDEALYLDAFGWSRAGVVPSEPPEGGHRLFGWDGAAVGSIANTARLEGVHHHWLFYLAMDDVDDAVARVRALGGTALDPIDLPGQGLRLAACEDPQGAAFGLASVRG